MSNYSFDNFIIRFDMVNEMELLRQVWQDYKNDMKDILNENDYAIRLKEYMEKDRLQKEMLWRRKQKIHQIGEEWSYIADVNLKKTLFQLQKEWKGKSATVFVEKGQELKAKMDKTGMMLLEI